MKITDNKTNVPSYTMSSIINCKNTQAVILKHFTVYCPCFSSVQFSLVTQSCLTLFDPMHCSTPGFPVHQQLLELAQTHVHRVSDAIQPSHPLSSSFSSCLQSFPASRSFPMSQFFSSGGQSIGVSASASVLPLLVSMLRGSLKEV